MIALIVPSGQARRPAGGEEWPRRLDEESSRWGGAGFSLAWTVLAAFSGLCFDGRYRLAGFRPRSRALQQEVSQGPRRQRAWPQRAGTSRLLGLVHWFTGLAAAAYRVSPKRSDTE